MAEELESMLTFIQQHTHEFLCTQCGTFFHGSGRTVCLFETERYIRGTLHRVCEACYSLLLEKAASRLGIALYKIWLKDGQWMYNADEACSYSQYVLGSWASGPHVAQAYEGKVREKYELLTSDVPI